MAKDVQLLAFLSIFSLKISYLYSGTYDLQMKAVKSMFFPESHTVNLDYASTTTGSTNTSTDYFGLSADALKRLAFETPLNGQLAPTVPASSQTLSTSTSSRESWSSLFNSSSMKSFIGPSHDNVTSSFSPIDKVGNHQQKGLIGHRRKFLESQNLSFSASVKLSLQRCSN